METQGRDADGAIDRPGLVRIGRQKRRRAALEGRGKRRALHHELLDLARVTAGGWLQLQHSAT